MTPRAPGTPPPVFDENRQNPAINTKPTEGPSSRDADPLKENKLKTFSNMNAECTAKPSGLYSLKQTREIIGCSPRALSNYRSSGLIPTHMRCGNKQKVIVGKDIISFMNRYK